MMKRTFYLLILLCCVVQLQGQRADMGKMSAFVRQLAMEQRMVQRGMRQAPGRHGHDRRLCAFVQISNKADSVFRANGCRQLARFGNIYIADVPLSRVGSLSLSRQVTRIEANRGMHALNDSAALHVNALPAMNGQAPLTQAYSGKGVVMGIQDVGFDLTHPNFYDRSLASYRIKALWDQLSADTVGSTMYVGAEYTSQQALLAYKHSRDGIKQNHGTHTLGTAAGSGFDTGYRGIAYESDICLVSNAVADDSEFIDSTDYAKYTYALDALGFKYIFDYAERNHQPCVISFSEGSQQDFRGDDRLYYQVLDSLSGPGRIIVSSAGNTGHYLTYFRKQTGMESMGSFLLLDKQKAYFTLKADQPFTLRLKGYGDEVDSLLIPSAVVLAAADPEYVDTVRWAGQQIVFQVVGYASTYNPQERVFDVLVQSMAPSGSTIPLSFELVGREATVEFFAGRGWLTSDGRDPRLCAGEHKYSINSPASAPSVICVGSTSYRTGFLNEKGTYISTPMGSGGERTYASSIGPTFDGRIKPDVMAPGMDLTSSYNSFFLEHYDYPASIDPVVKRFDWNGRTYAWSNNSGTSMSAPVVGGAIALWLQARPDLTRQDVMDVLAHTCRRPDPSLSYPNNEYGYGEIDVYRGLLYILGIDGIEGISASQPAKVRFSLSGHGMLEMQVDGGVTNHLLVRVYTVSGQLVMTKSLAEHGSSYRLDMSALPKGVYAVQVNGRGEGVTGSTLIRL